MQIVHRFLYRGDAGAEVHTFKASGDLYQSLQILAANFRLSRIHAEGRQGTKSCCAAGRTGQQRVAHTVERRAVLLGKANANGVGAVIENHWGCSRLALQNSRGVDRHFLGSETCACRYHGIHLVRNGRTADGILDSVQNVHDGVRVPSDLDFVERISDARRGFVEELAVLRKELDHNRLGCAGQVAANILQELNELNFRGGFSRFDLGPDIFNNIVNIAFAISLQPDGEIPIVRFGDGGKAELH